MSSDLRPFVAEEIRLHPRIAYQGLLSEEGAATRVAAALPPLARFRHDYVGAISIVDWDHRLPSQNLVLRVYGYYGYTPFWGPGYIPPTRPMPRRLW